MNLLLNTAELIRKNWDRITPEQIAELETEGTIRTVVHATNNQEIFGAIYQGSAAIRRVYVFGQSNDPADIVGVKHDWVRVDNIDPNNVYATIGMGVQLEPRIQAALIQTNDGQFPNILAPVIPTAAPSPEPEEPPTEPEPPQEPES